MNRKVLVTGASRGIGRQIALQLGKDNFEITVHYHKNAAMAEQTAAEIRGAGGQANTLSFDISDRETCRQILEARVESSGPYYGVVCNAGITRDNAFPAMSGEEWDEVMRTNLDGFFNVLHPLIMPMIHGKFGGRIVTLSSISGLTGNRGQTNYSAAKAGIIAATKSLAIELAKRNITVNCVAPGVIETEMTKEMLNDETIRSEIKGLIPLRRFGKAEEVAALVSFLFSDMAGYVTRQVISVNGGMV